MQRIGVLNGNNITYDHDFAGLVRGLTDWGVIQGGEISENKVQPVQAVIACQRSNGQKLMLYFESDEQVSIPSSGTFKVYIEVNQAKIDDGTGNAENGTWIAEIKTWPSVPSQNFLLLASVAENVVKDERNLIPKIQSVAQKTSTLEEKLSTAEGQITQLVEAGTPRYLGITGIVWEKYTMEDTLFLQKTPTFTNSAIAINVGDIDKNKEIHIQRIGSWTASNQLKLKLKKFWAPTTSVVVEVRKWVKVDVSDKEAYRYGGEIIATTTIAYTEFLADWKEFTLTLNNQFGGTKGELLDIVVYQQGKIVNSTNYYQIACDSTQYSEAFSYVSVNSSSRVREKLMPYCISDWFAQWLLAKVANVLIVNNTPVLKTDIPSKKVEVSRYNWEVVLASFYAENNTQIRVQFHTPNYSSEYGIKIKKNNQQIWSEYNSRADEVITLTRWDTITVVAWNTSSSNRTITAQDVKIYDNNPWLNKRGFILNPRWINDIGKNTECTSFWLHTDNSWLGDQVDVSTVLNSATTWSIPLGNAIGFFKIQSKDWKTYKIPVYGD